MGAVTSTLTMRLIDQVSGKARAVEKSLGNLDRKARQIAGTTATGLKAVARQSEQSAAAVAKMTKTMAPLGATSSSSSPAAGLAAVATQARAAEAALTRAGRAAAPLLRPGGTTTGRLLRPVPVLPARSGGEPPAASPGGRHGDSYSKTAATVAAGETAKTIAEHAAEAATALERQRIDADVAGLSPAETKEVEDRALALSRKYPSVSQTAVMQMLRNARAATGDLHHGFEVMDPLVRLRVLAQAKHPDQDVSGEFDNLVRGMEIKGVAQNTEKFTHYMDAMAKAINTFGETVTPSAYYQAFKFGRGATPGYSDEYMLKVAPTITSEMGGSSAGTAGSAFHQAIIGRRLSQGALHELDALGLLDKDRISYGKGGKINTLPGAVVGTDLARRDPYEWINKVLLPAFTKKGITETGDIGDHIANVFGNRMAQQLAMIFATQQQRIEKDRRNIEGAKGLSAADEYLARDPAQGLAAVAAQTKNLLGNAASPMVPAATTVIGTLADVLGRLAEAAKNHPREAAEGLVGGTALAGWGAAEAATAIMHMLGFGGGAAARGGGFLARLLAVGRLAGPVGLGVAGANILAEGLMAGDDTGRTHPYGAPGDAWKQKYEENRRANTDLIENQNRAEARRAWRDGSLMDAYPDFGFHRASPAGGTVQVPVAVLDTGNLLAEAAAAARQVQQIFETYRPIIRPDLQMPSMPSGRSLRDALDGSHSDNGGRR